MTNIAIIGAGAWGTALAQCYAGAGHRVALVVRTNELAEEIKKTRVNQTYLADIQLHDTINILPLNQFIETGDGAKFDIILNVTPTQFLRTNLQQIHAVLPKDAPMVICAKGMEIGTDSLPLMIAAEECPTIRLAYLSGPNFARDIARGLPSASTLAGEVEVTDDVIAHLTARNLRLYASRDIWGAQIGGAIKNVIAIACGLCHGLELGESARAALVTRGLAEIARLSETMGGKRETLLGQCGVGDLMLTCSSAQSRNFSLGLELAGGKTLTQITRSRTSIAEGVTTSRAAYHFAKTRGVDMPIVETVYRCLYEDLSLGHALDHILSRPPRAETH